MKYALWLLLFVACNIESDSRQHAAPLNTTPPASAPQNVRVGAIEYRYDHVGRVVGKGDLELTYGPDGHLATAKRGQDVWSYAYDEKGNRILKKKNGRPVAAFLDGTYIIEDKIYTPIYVQGRLIGVLEGGQFHLLGVDPRGTVITDRDGTPRPASPYGVRATRPDISEALDYIEKGYDPVLGTVRMGARDYDPYLGQFWTPDPLYFEHPERCIDSPVECNLYSYARNNPVSHTDPSGLGVDLFQRAESESYCAQNPVQCQAAVPPTMSEIASRGLDLGGQMATQILYFGAVGVFCGGSCSEAGEGAASSKGAVDNVFDALLSAPVVGPTSKGAYQGIGRMLRGAGAGAGPRATITMSRTVIPRISASSLPTEESGRVLATLRQIETGLKPRNPLGKNWGVRYGNDKGFLPGGRFEASPYLEYRVAPPPGLRQAGPSRIVVNQQTGEVYYTWTHYGDMGNPAFVQIR